MEKYPTMHARCGWYLQEPAYIKPSVSIIPAQYPNRDFCRFTIVTSHLSIIVSQTPTVNPSYTIMAKATSNVTEFGAIIASITHNLDGYSEGLQNWLCLFKQSAQPLSDYTIEELSPLAALLKSANILHTIALLDCDSQTLLPEGFFPWTGKATCDRYITNTDNPILERNSLHIYRRYYEARETLLPLRKEIQDVIAAKFNIKKPELEQRLHENRKAVLLSQAIHQPMSEEDQDVLYGEFVATQTEKFHKADSVEYSPLTGITFNFKDGETAL